MAKNKKIITAALIVLSLFAVLWVLYFFHIFDYLEYKAYDSRVRFFAANYKPSDDIVAIMLDQDSIDWANRERGWGWPWPRKAYADIVDYMSLGGAKSVAFDVLFSEPSIYRDADHDEAGITADDNAFAHAGSSNGRVVQTVFFSTQTGSSHTWPPGIQKPLFNLDGFEPIISGYTLTDERLGAQFPVPVLNDAAGALGNVTNAHDSDGINRRTRLFINFDGRAVPGLSAASLLVSGAGGAIFYNEKKRRIEWEDYIIPVDGEGKSILRFRGNLNRYMPYKASAVLQSAEALKKGGEPMFSPGDFKDKYVFFGLYAPGLFDICSNPIESVYPGMGIHITMLDNILSGDFIRETSMRADLVILFVIVLLTTALILFSHKLQFTISGTLLIAATVVVGAFVAYDKFCLWFPMVMPLAALLGSFLTCTIYNYETEGRQKRFIKSAFSRYLSPIYIDQLIANPGQLRLGGERREISIFFSDVQGFSTIAENLDPEQLKELLNEYLTLLTNIIQDSGGTIDKYEGDAIIAFWNAPLRQEDHASRALGAAIACQIRLAEKAEHFEEKFKNWNITAPGINKRLFTRIGLNTGYAVVGNFGSEKHFNYTMLGDAVNLAARLEGLNKQFGTSMMCSERTFEEAKKNGRFYGRALAIVAVVGKNEPVAVWEPLTEAAYREKESIIRQFDEARDIFYEGNFSMAIELFEAIKDKDNPAGYYVEQCRYYLEESSEWQGFWKALSK